jgi:hypothetical protein
MKEEKDDSKKRNGKRPRLILWETFDAERHHSWGWENLHGEILREFDESGRQVSIGAKVYIKCEESYIWSRDTDIAKLTENLEVLLWLRNECGIHDEVAKYSHVAESVFYLN